VIEVPSDQVAPAAQEPEVRRDDGARRALGLLLRFAMPLISILALWYLAIYFSALPAFVIPRPERVLQTLFNDRSFITVHLVETLKVATIGFILSNMVGIGLAVLFLAFPLGRQLIMPAAITLRNMPYVALVTVLVLAFGDSLGSKVTIVVLAGFFPVLVNTSRGLQAADPVALDRMRVLNASWWETFVHVRLPYSLPFIVSAQEITGSGSIIVAIAAEWMISSTGLGYIINRAMQQYRGDQVYAVAFLAALLSFMVYALVHFIGERLNWQSGTGDRG
jgi:ABC-type nitrate/sulfonate/bicarbonate transport system permease component